MCVCETQTVQYDHVLAHVRARAHTCTSTTLPSHSRSTLRYVSVCPLTPNRFLHALSVGASSDWSNLTVSPDRWFNNVIFQLQEHRGESGSSHLGHVSPMELQDHRSNQKSDWSNYSGCVCDDKALSQFIHKTLALLTKNRSNYMVGLE